MTIGLLSIAKLNLVQVGALAIPVGTGTVGFSQTSPSGTLSVGAMAIPVTMGAVTFSSGAGLQIVLVQDASVSGAPAGFMTDANTAAGLIMAACPNTNVTVYINVGYGTSALFGSIPSTSAEGGDTQGSFLSYSVIRAGMAANNNSTTMNTLLANTPSGTSLNGQSSFYVPSACMKALGIGGISPTSTVMDGACVIGTGITHPNLVGVFLHELTHAMGRETGVAPVEFSRFNSVGNRDFDSGGTTGAYFSLDGGTTHTADYATPSTDPSDFLNSGIQDGNSSATYDPFDAFYGSQSIQSLTTADIQLLNAMGFQ